MIEENIQRGIYGNDIRNKAASYASAGSDARMSGCSLPVMTTSGSGNQGMTASLPVIRYCRERNVSYEQMIRGLFIRSEEHTSELQSRQYLVCRLLLEKKKSTFYNT